MLLGTSRSFEMLKECAVCNCPESGEFPQGLAGTRTSYVSGQNDKSSQHLLPQQWLSEDTLFKQFWEFLIATEYLLWRYFNITIWTTTYNVSNILNFKYSIRKVFCTYCNDRQSWFFPFELKFWFNTGRGEGVIWNFTPFYNCKSTQIIDWESVVEYVSNPGGGFVGGQCETNELFLHSPHSLPSLVIALHRELLLVIARQDLSADCGRKFSSSYTLR